MFKKGQAYKDLKLISLIDYENILDAGFENVELVPIHKSRREGLIFKDFENIKI